MATTLLPSHDCLRKSSRRNPRVYHSGSRRKRRSDADQSRSLVIKLPAQNILAMGHIKILKHGEAVPPCMIKKEKVEEEDEEEEEKEIEVCSSSNIESESDDVENFAGWGFSTSPSPKSVPLPRFLASTEAARGFG